MEHICNRISLPARVLRIAAVTCLALLYTNPAARAETPADTVRLKITAVRIEDDLPLTGSLDDPRWSRSTPVSLSYEVTPNENTPAVQRTSVRVLYNSHNLYIGFDCRDTDPEAIRAHITDRDKPFDDDFILAILDTYGDYQRAYEFLVNPYGIQADLLRTTNNEDASFDAVWESAAAMNDSGWTAELAIPFKSLRFPARPDQHWVVDFIRNIPRVSRVQNSWVPIDKNNPCLTCQAGTLEGISGIQSTSSVDILPYIVGQESGSVSDNSNPGSGFVNGSVTGRVGSGLRYAPSPDFAVEAVINPDFSQVESDATQISVNSNFALFYPEKRPFFLLGADMFSNSTQIFYSRSINNPLGAARVIGKTGSLSYAYLATTDRNTPYIVPGEETSDLVASDVESFSNIARARYDFGGENFIGGMLTTRNSTDAHNYVGGVDWNSKFWGNYYFRGELFSSDTKELNDTTLLDNTRMFGSTGRDAAFNGESYGGFSANINFLRDAREYSFDLQYLDRSPTFQAQDGFIPSNDLRMLLLSQGYTFYPNNSWLERWSISANSGLHYNYDNVHKETWTLPNLDMQFRGQTELTVLWFAVNDELYKDVMFRKIIRTEVSVYSRPASSLTLSLDGTFGKFIKRTDDPEMGRGHNINISAEIRPTSQLDITLAYSRSRLSSAATGELFYDGYITRATAIYQFSRELYFRLIGQYDQFNSALDVYPLLSYKLNPYTIFYAGSTYSLTEYGTPYGLRETGRQYFIKLQYLIRT
ncbi:MAG TPA: DUF5916 domain-containing protein [Bacteroidota bacterium]|nr:DUF5916 domain-containing protein [Bacteroidota bacterium]